MSNLVKKNVFSLRQSELSTLWNQFSCHVDFTHFNFYGKSNLSFVVYAPSFFKNKRFQPPFHNDIYHFKKWFRVEKFVRCSFLDYLLSLSDVSILDSIISLVPHIYIEVYSADKFYCTVDAHLTFNKSYEK